MPVHLHQDVLFAHQDKIAYDGRIAVEKQDAAVHMHGDAVLYGKRLQLRAGKLFPKRGPQHIRAVIGHGLGNERFRQRRCQAHAVGSRLILALGAYVGYGRGVDPHPGPSVAHSHPAQLGEDGDLLLKACRNGFTVLVEEQHLRMQAGERL